MADKVYVGEKEFRCAVLQTRNRLARAGSSDEMLPCRVDASYIHEKYGPVPITLVMERYVSKHRAEPCYTIKIEVKLPHCKVSDILMIDPREKIERWFEEVERSDTAWHFYVIYIASNRSPTDRACCRYFYAGIMVVGGEPSCCPPCVPARDIARKVEQGDGPHR